MSEQIKKVLSMVEQGKISSEEATKLIESITKLNGNEENDDNFVEAEAVVVTEKVEEPKEQKQEKVFVEVPFEQGKTFNEKMFKVRITSSDGDKIRVTLPINFIKGVIGTFGKIPNVNLEGMEGVNPDEIMKTVMAAIDNDVVGEIVNIESADGDIIKIIIE